MAFDFPNSPSIGDTVTTPNGGVFTWDGIKWVAINVALPAYAPLASPVFTGDPKAPTPAAGDADTSIATTAFVQTAVAPAVHNVGRNLLHNPLFNVAQRGTGPFTYPGYTADRWATTGQGCTGTTSIYPIADGGRAAIGDETAEWQVNNVFTGTSAANDTYQFTQKIEDVRRLGNKTVTVSFWASTGSGVLNLGIIASQIFGTGGSPSAGAFSNQVTLSITSAWTRYTATLNVPSTAGKTLGTDGNSYTGLVFIMSQQGGAVGVQSGTIALWGVQLEVGSVATPLEKPDPRYDLANCQRHYFTSGYNVQGFAGNAGWLNYQTLLLPVTMRATPTVALTDSNVSNISSPGILANDQRSVALFGTYTAANGFAMWGTFSASAEV